MVHGGRLVWLTAGSKCTRSHLAFAHQCWLAWPLCPPPGGSRRAGMTTGSFRVAPASAAAATGSLEPRKPLPAMPSGFVTVT